jgi:GNAT superfamily N-acetyltransferase
MGYKSGMTALVRVLGTHDLPAVHALQAQCYPEGYQEPIAAFAAKLAASPLTAWGVDHPHQPGNLLAYLFCLPVQGLHWPSLHSTHCVAPGQADGLYLHDLSLHPTARGQGLGKALLHQAQQWALSRRLFALRLIAVQGSAPYWQKQGFARLPDEALEAQAVDLSSFGAQACAMSMSLQD